MKNLITEQKFNEILSAFENLKPLLVVGDVGIDKYTFGEVKRISPEAPVPVLEVTKEWLKLGLAANISHNLQTLQIPSTLCGVIGDDKNADVFEDLLEDNHLKTWGLIRSSDRPTTFKERVTTNTQQICRIDYESSESINDTVAQKFIARIEELSKTHSAIILEDYAKGAMTQRVIEDVIKFSNQNNILVAVDPGRTTPPLFYQGATLLKPNLVEAKAMVEFLGFKEKKVEKLAEILIDKLKIEKLVITLGPEGMALYDSKVHKSLQYIPTVANEVFDVSGAGDTAIALLTSSLVAGATLEEAAWISNCGAGVVVGKKGTATVDQKELKDFYGNLKKRFI